MRLALVPLVALLASPQTADLPTRTATQFFERGQTFEQFLNAVVAQRVLWHTNAVRAATPSDLAARLRRVGGGLRILIVAEDWCPDSVNTVPYVAKLAVAADLGLRIVHRADGQAVMALHRTPDGRTATPTIVLLRDGRDAGAWVERPAFLQQLFLSMATQPESVQRFANRQAWYDADAGVTTLTELVTLAEQTFVRR